MKEKVKQYLVLGLGRFGESLAKSLCQLGHEVLAVDSDQELVDAIAPYVTQAIQIDATDEGALQSLGVRNFDAAIVSIGQNMRDSILVCVLLKELGTPYLIAKATDDLHAKVLRKVGVDRVIFPERDMGMRLAKSLLTPNVLEMIDLSDDYQLVEIILPKKWVGNTIIGMDVRKRFGISILAIHRSGDFIVSPVPETQFETGDILLVLGKKDDIDNLDQ
ncbi:MAG TPA: TrkA family potassium uptake protein [Candidatus Limiplasma sp.]|nr:TrkA family potassium uptake protein [Candidatus Limiplasma sp.]HPS81391.1 TrkA family potassium uptake protein [Candidatus Limiplasma sp.]